MLWRMIRVDSIVPMTDAPRQLERPRTIVTVDRCTCHDVRFAAIAQWSTARASTTIKDIEDQWCSGTSCGMCRPYLSHMLKTGDTTIPMIMPSDNP